MRHLLVVLGFGAGVLASGACFTAPNADVQFSCDLDTASACPPGYTCQDDGCCHRDGSDVDANRGSCRLVNTGGLTDSPTGTETGTGTETTSGTDTPSGTDATSDTDTTSDTGSTTDTDSGSGTGSGSGSGSGTDSSTSA